MTRYSAARELLPHVFPDGFPGGHVSLFPRVSIFSTGF